MDLEQGKQFVESVMNNVWVSANPDLVAQYYSPNVVGHIGKNTVKFDDIKGRVNYVSQNTQNRRITFKDFFINGDNKVAFNFNFTYQENGTDQNFEAIAIYHVKDGKVAELWIQTDTPIEYKTSN